MKIRAHIGWLFSTLVFAAFCIFIYAVYPKDNGVVKEVGYSAEYRARLDDLIAGITPLSVADLGE